MGSELCVGDNLNGSTPEQCASRRGGLIDTSSEDSSFIGLPIDKANLTSDRVWARIMKPLQPYKVAGTVDLDLKHNLRLQNLTVAVITEGQNHNAGHLGLGPNSTVLAGLISQGAIHDKGFGLNAGSQSYDKPRPGSLVLGGYDKANVIGAFREYPMNRSSDDRNCPLQLNVVRLVLRRPGQDDVDLSPKGVIVPSCIEPYDNLFRMLPYVLDDFRQNTDWSNDTVVPNDLYVVEPGLLYPSNVGFDGSLVFSLEDGWDVEVPNEELQHPLRGLDADGQMQLRNNTTEVNIFAEPALLDKAVLGKAFLSQVYLAVDYSKGMFMLAPLLPNAQGSDLVPFSPDSASCSSGKAGINKGLLIGLIVAVCLVAILLLLWVAIYLTNRGRVPPRIARVVHRATGGGPEIILLRPNGCNCG
ncbi:hypothetical protein H2201_000319 [Coniosporium apollinis]|uniref:Peptidase A1 domain-containing protein n=2 Tax=Coniosporium TaxID=2810619 RepID=A0ABQ9P4B5_9PEZI|nr:hypothetical protein H2199_003508 [Cladosporium sp. JES 115]KAJ9669452.1 hypothetical protein H2201_000319 [Coniosporium apollinis]